jgi:pSer/pThr/pTyr-binding forkhead associated (FHA) protein
MKYRHVRQIAVLIGLVCIAAGAFAAPRMEITRISTLSHELGKDVTVEGRTGYIVSESPGIHVFTLRGDYNDQVLVRSIGTNRPIMGATYRIEGTPTPINGTLYLNTADSMMSAVYPQGSERVLVPAQTSLKSQILLWAPSGICLLAALIVLIVALRRWTKQPAPEWGVLSVTSGPDRGMNVPLRRKRIAIGRGVSPARDIRLSTSDQTISNTHVVLEHRHGELFVCDMSSNGTRIGGEKLMPGKKVQVNSGDLIHLGTRGTVVIVRLHAVAPTPSLFGFLHESAPLSDKTIILPEQSMEEPAWKNTTADHAPSDMIPHSFEAAKETSEHLNGFHAPTNAEDYADETETTPVEEASVPAAVGEDDVDDEDDIPHTFAPPLVFTFAGHAPKPSRLAGYEPMEQDANSDEGGSHETAA